MNDNSKSKQYSKCNEQPLIFIECLKLLEKLVQENLIPQDTNNPNNILVYRKAGANNPEGWYSENIHTAAQELLHDIKGQRYLLNVLSEKGISLERKKEC